MEIFRPELHAWVYKAILEVVKEGLGAAEVASILTHFGLTESQLQDREAWVSQEFTEAFLTEVLQRGGDPQLFDRSARLAISPRYLGPLYAFVRAFGNVSSTYDRLASSTPRFNKTGSYAVEHTGRASCRLTFTPTPGMRRERTTHLCRFRSVQMAAIPTLFDLAPAKLSELKCVVRGDDCCVYDLEWQQPPNRRIAQRGALIGTATGIGLAWSAHLPWMSSAVSSAVCLLCGWALGRILEQRHDVAARVQDLNDHQDALGRSMRANEERFEQLVQAKAEVDQKVEQRTKELRDATQRLSETLEEIQALDRAKTDFFNNVSHELRSPLTLILAPLEDMAAGREPPSGYRTTFESMQRNALRLLRLINQLLDLAKVDAGGVKIALVPTDLIGLVKSMLEGFAPAAQRKGVSIDFAAPSSLPPIAIDASWIESALTNLVANALRLTEGGRSIRISIEDLGSDIRIGVSDEGPGISSADQKKVFERFAQGDSTKRVVGGTGIGLALVREAARLHGGDVKLVSELGHGATFTVTLPRRTGIQIDERSPARTPSISPRQLIPDEFRPDHGVMERSGPTEQASLVLVVEDNPELREFMSDVLAVRYRVRAVGDGVKALAAVRESPPEVIVSDVAMPEMDGYELCRRLRADRETAAIPILLVTARTEVTSILEGFEAGANDYVSKPFHGRELLARVDVHVRLRRMVQELALRERHAMLGVLAASIAHQVRNPLTTLVSGLPAMKMRLDGKVGQSTHDLIDVMIDCAERIERLTRDLMDLSRVDREEAGDYRPSDGLHAAVRLVRARLPDSITIEERIESSPIASGRPGDMNHVFLNLLDNALRAVGSAGRISVHAVTRGNEYVVRVGDSGPGMTEAVAKRVFEPFFTTRPAGEGTGLGLAVAQQVMKQCGGSITIGSGELGGAEFTVTIPVASAESIAANPDSSAAGGLPH